MQTTKIDLSVSPTATIHRSRCSFLSRGVASVHQKGCATFYLLALLFLAALSVGHGQSLPDLITYNFAVLETKVLPGTSASPGSCSGTIAAADQIGNLALVALPFVNTDCWTDGQYNHNNYLVERGTVSTNGGAGIAAYRIYEPQHKATQFLASKHGIYYRFPTIENYSVYAFANGSLTKVADVPASAIPNTTTFIPVPTATNTITVSAVTGSVTYVFAPSSIRVSAFTLLAAGIEGARVASTPFGDVLKYRYTVAGTPFDTATGFSAGPGDFGNTYSNPRRFFLVRNGNGLGAIWQDQVNSSLKLTWFGTNRISPTTVALANPQAETLACAAGDDTGNVYYLTVQPGSGAPTNSRTATLTKAGPTGTTIATAAVDTSVNGLDMVQFFSCASMKYLNGKLGVMINLTIHLTPDGLNHESGRGVIFNATTLALDKNWGQTSGHSWESVLTSNTNGDFVGIDLGDNYPRGVHLHKFNSTNRYSRVISSFKTAHGTTSNSPANIIYPVYPEISTNGTTYYKWSNDNKVYTELGGVAQTSLGYAASFVGERSAAGRLLDNARVGGGLNDPRNVGFITVVENFQNASGTGMQVSDDLVRTSGLVETNGFYDFGGGWAPQRNAGVVWLSNYTNLTQNASRLKMTPRADGSLLLLWELWASSSYVATKGMTIRTNGTILNAETDLSNLVRLGRRDDLFRLNNDIYLAAGNKADPALELIVIQPVSSTGPTATTLAATAVTTSGATLNGSGVPNGTATSGYFQWGTNTSYGTTSAPASLGSGSSTVPFSTALSGLVPSRTYHYRAVASNSLGVAYGNDMSFTTPTPPIVTTVAATAVTTNGATLNGSANPNGFAAIGFFQWDTTTNYGQTTASTALGTGSSAVPFSTALSGLVPGQTYHYRAAASNAAGVVYGNNMSFTNATVPVGPIVTTLAATGVTSNSATLNASVNPNGLASTSFFQWGTTTNYGQTTGSTALGNGSSALSFWTLVSGLVPGQIYHYRAVASNTAAVVYGNDMSFTTTTVTVGPSATTLAATAVTSNSATLNGSANPNGLAAIGYFQWGTTTGYGQNTTPGNLGSGISAVPLSASLSWLTAGVTYHFRAAASNSVGIVYGNDLTFTPPVTFAPPVSTFTGGDAGEGLDLQGTFVHAVNLGSNGAPGLIGAANFTTDTAANVSVTAPGGILYTVDNWAAPNFGATVNDDRLEQAMSSMRWTGLPGKLTVTLGALQAGRSYKLQLLFIESCCDRAFDVKVNAVTVKGAFRLQDYGTNGKPLAITYTFTAAGASAIIELGGNTPAGLDGNPTLSALTLEDVTVPGITPLQITGPTRLLNGDFQFNFTGASGTNYTVLATTNIALPSSAWSTLGLATETPPGSGQFRFTDTQTAASSRKFYRLATGVPVGSVGGVRWATQVLGFSSQYSTTGWSAAQALGQPDTYPAYGDLPTAWSPLLADGPAEFLELGFDAPAPISSVSIYETYSPGAVSKVSVRNPNTGLWVEVWSGTAAPVAGGARIFPVNFPRTSYPVDAIRLDLSSAAVTDYNEIDAVSITSNDNFTNRTSLNGVPLNVSASNVDATKEASEPNHAGNIGGRSLWWSWTAPSNGSVTFSTAGSSIDTVLAVYTGTALNALTVVAANDDFDGNLYSKVTFTATQNVTYQIAVDGYNGGTGAATGNILLNVTMP